MRRIYWKIVQYYLSINISLFICGDLVAAQHFPQLVVRPSSIYAFPFGRGGVLGNFVVIDSSPVDKIIHEFSLVFLPVAEEQDAKPVFHVIFEMAFILGHPAVVSVFQGNGKIFVVIVILLNFLNILNAGRTRTISKGSFAISH